MAEVEFDAFAIKTGRNTGNDGRDCLLKFAIDVKVRMLNVAISYSSTELLALPQHRNCLDTRRRRRRSKERRSNWEEENSTRGVTTSINTPTGGRG